MVILNIERCIYAVCLICIRCLICFQSLECTTIDIYYVVATCIDYRVTTSCVTLLTTYISTTIDIYNSIILSTTSPYRTCRTLNNTLTLNSEITIDDNCLASTILKAIGLVDNIITIKVDSSLNIFMNNNGCKDCNTLIQGEFATNLTPTAKLLLHIVQLSLLL